MTEILGILTMALVVVGYIRFEWIASETDRQRRAQMADELRGK